MSRSCTTAPCRKQCREWLWNNPLGLFASATFQSGLVEVEPGDILALTTDGLPEVTDTKDEHFGLERIEEIVVRNAGGSLADLAETLFAAVRAYGPQTDDETLVLVRAVDVRSP